MKTNTKFLFFCLMSSILFVNKVNSQSTTTGNTYNSTYFLGWGSTSGDLPFKVNNSTKMTLQNTTGYLGIGTTAPLGVLHATAANGAGSWSYFTGNVSSTNPSTTFAGGLALGYNVRGTCEANIVSGPADCGTAGGFRFQNWSYSAGGTLTDLVTILGTSGNTGIGTTTPASKLDVEGGFAVGATYAGTTAAPTNGAIIEGNTGVGTSAPSTINGNASVTGKLFNLGNASGRTIANSEGTTEANFSLVSTSSNTNQKWMIIRHTSGKTIFAPHSDGGSSLYNAIVIQHSNGFVGINNNAPSYQLDITGNARVNGIMGVNTAPVAGNDITINGNGVSNTGTWTSDQQFKTNIDSLSNAIAIIKQLKPRSFYFDTTNVYGFKFPSKKQYGFIAQELEELLPELITNNSKAADIDTLGNVIHPAIDFKAVYYLELIAVLTKGMQEQQQKIEDLQTQLNNFQNTVNNCCSLSENRSMQNPTNPSNENVGNNMLSRQTKVNLNDYKSITLEQNVPNPFSEQTLITYNIPENASRAQIMFYNFNGKLIHTEELAKKGLGSLNIFANDLSSGIYSYTLIIDGKIIETKKMIKQ
ncbi:MAG: tail fiber domain-containing protein [Bacteroidia bacterium]